ncbi:hypothetical protein BJQ94_08755 [Cryobacterium sp. SO2]|jgi:hypothetical protein|nr:hypothetical protein [Cryobacterium sp. SO2]WEO79105.1 hypothetical protein BJQ94_08755 [Cryobacterium sp. SO2]
MSENTTSTVTDAPAAPRPIIQLLEQSDDAGGCCGGGSCGI